MKKIILIFQITFVAFITLTGVTFLKHQPAKANFTGYQNEYFYGPGLNADGLANIRLGAKDGYTCDHRFLATNTGLLESIRTYIIYSSSKPGYSDGTGGTVHVEIQTDDNSSSHLPSGIVLASADRVYHLTTPDADNPKFPLFTFSPMPQLQAGTLYHAVYTNTDADPANNYVSIDHLYTSSKPTPAQPTISDTNWTTFFHSAGTNWNLAPEYTPILELDYADEASGGVGYMEVWSEDPKTISGDNKVREIFTVSGPDRTISNLSIRLGRESGTDNLSLRLENSDGGLIEEGNLSADNFPAPVSGDTRLNYVWATITFNTSHTLASGQTYHIVLSSPDTSAYKIFPIRKGVEYDFQPSTYFSDGYAQYTPDGSTWHLWPFWGYGHETGDTEADLQFYFTLSSSSPTLTKSVSKATANSGDVLTYTLSYQGGNVAVTEAVISDTIPAGMTYISGGTYSAGKVTWTIGDLAANGTGSVTLTVKVN